MISLPRNGGRVTLGEINRNVQAIAARLDNLQASMVSPDVYEAHRKSQGQRIGDVETGLTALETKLSTETDKLWVEVSRNSEWRAQSQGRDRLIGAALSGGLFGFVALAIEAVRIIGG